MQKAPKSHHVPSLVSPTCRWNSMLPPLLASGPRHWWRRSPTCAPEARPSTYIQCSARSFTGFRQAQQWPQPQNMTTFFGIITGCHCEFFVWHDSWFVSLLFCSLPYRGFEKPCDYQLKKLGTLSLHMAQVTMAVRFCQVILCHAKRSSLLSPDLSETCPKVSVGL